MIKSYPYIAYLHNLIYKEKCTPSLSWSHSSLQASFSRKFMSSKSSLSGKVYIPSCLNCFIISWVQTALQSSSVFLMKRDRSRKSLLSHERTVTDGDGHFPEGNSPSESRELIQLPQSAAISLDKQSMPQARQPQRSNAKHWLWIKTYLTFLILFTLTHLENCKFYQNYVN